MTHREPTVFSDSNTTLQMLEFPSGNNDFLQPIQKIIRLDQYRLANRNGITFQWIPRHSGIIGHNTADTTAKRTLLWARTVIIPFLRLDAARLVWKLVWDITLYLCQLAGYHYTFLHDLDPLLIFPFSRNMSRLNKSLRHIPRLNVAHTKSYSR